MHLKRFVRALRKGCTLTIGTDHQRIRIVRIEDAEGALVGYGEDAELTTALTRAATTYKRGLGTYEEEFPTGRRWLSGSRRCANTLDGLLLRRGFFSAALHEDGFLVRLEVRDLPPIEAVRNSLNRAVRAAVRDAQQARRELFAAP